VLDAIHVPQSWTPYVLICPAWGGVEVVALLSAGAATTTFTVAIDAE